jgi:molecular chaperone DnaK
VLLVGGSSRMPAVERALREVSGIEAEASVNPDEAVARGAAIFARYLLGQRGIDAKAPKLRITDVNAHGLGIEGVNLQTLRAENVTLIPRNTPLPCRIKRTFVTRTDNQPNVKVQLLEGESSLPGQCSRLATAMIRNLPHGLPKGTPIEVRYALESNGRLAVSAAIPSQGENVQIELQRVRGMADRRVQRWQRIICRDGGFRDVHEALASAIKRTSGVAKADSLQGSNAKARLLNVDVDDDFDALTPEVDSLEMPSVADKEPVAGPAGMWNLVTDAPDDEPLLVRPPRRRPGERFPLPVRVAGHVAGALVGLALGYYALCFVRPDLNFLHLDLPGIRADMRVGG